MSVKMISSQVKPLSELLAEDDFANKEAEVLSADVAAETRTRDLGDIFAEHEAEEKAKYDRWAADPAEQEKLRQRVAERAAAAALEPDIEPGDSEDDEDEEEEDLDEDGEG
jgi:hypothetical protein